MADRFKAGDKVLVKGEVAFVHGNDRLNIETGEGPGGKHTMSGIHQDLVELDPTAPKQGAKEAEPKPAA